eukprot:CAMPEP_0171103238 /NCGR_PEP_ID=MMETSP0766_2-20121228/58810_1 /TAXON_ID=439317 /ORGANISM="Gambierdiscus australes, Strain CAWD 149" /LENGTH=160 /DNA_ID=CAMNT_0011563647 /DNA_START=55 /DNA_END=537 /DNA_ORIENTATION=-
MANKKAAADAFAEKFNATPASGHEADRFRAADDRLKSLDTASLSSLRSLGSAQELPPEIVAVLECWCLLHNERPASVATCAKLAADPDDMRLVGMSTLEYMPQEDLDQVASRIVAVDAEVARGRKVAMAEAAATMIEWLQAALALQRWASQQRAATREHL